MQTINPITARSPQQRLHTSRQSKQPYLVMLWHLRWSLHQHVQPPATPPTRKVASPNFSENALLGRSTLLNREKVSPHRSISRTRLCTLSNTNSSRHNKHSMPRPTVPKSSRRQSLRAKAHRPPYRISFKRQGRAIGRRPKPSPMKLKNTREPRECSLNNKNFSATSSSLHTPCQTALVRKDPWSWPS